MAPEVSVRTGLADPVFVHPCKQIILAEGLEESADIRAGVWGHHSAVLLAVGSIRRRDRIVLAAEIAVLRVRAIAVP